MTYGRGIVIDACADRPVARVMTFKSITGRRASVDIGPMIMMILARMTSLCRSAHQGGAAAG